MRYNRLNSPTTFPANAIKDKVLNEIMLDFSHKALHKVSHQKLITKVSGIGVDSQVCNCDTSILSSRTLLVVVDRHRSLACDVFFSVSQSSVVIGPTLFLICKKDLSGSVRITYQPGCLQMSHGIYLNMENSTF